MGDEPSALERFYWDSVVGPLPAAERLRELNRVFAQHADNLIAATDRRPPCEVFVGGYPTHSANAFVSLQEEGAIILVHEGLLEVAFVLGSILAASVPGETEGRVEPPELGERPANTLIAGTVTALVRGRSQVPYQVRSAPRQLLASFLSEYLVDYVLAHELAHVFLGHIEAEVEQVMTSAGGELEINLPAWQQELAADLLGFELVAATLPDRVTTESRYMPASVFFELLESEESVRRPRSSNGTDLQHVAELVTHPPAAHRRSALVVSTHPDGALAVMPRLSMIVDRMAAARGRSLPRPDRQALDRLVSRASTCDPTALEAAIGSADTVSGMTSIDMSRLRTFLADDLERARGALALTTIGAAASSSATRELFRLHLGAVLLCLPAAIAEDHDLLVLVGKCVPDAAELTREVERMVTGINRI